MNPDSVTPLSAAELDEIEEQAQGGCYANPEDAIRLVAMARRALVMEQAVEAAWASTYALLSDMEATDD